MSSDATPQDMGVTPPTVGDEGQLSITGLAAGGRGVARDSSGRVWFVRGGIPGDRVVARVTKIRPRSGEAEALRRLEDGPGRRDPICRIQDRCGGCPWMVLDESAQADAKTTLVRDALERVGRLREPAIEPLRPGDPGLGYRSRIELTFSPHRRGNQLGFRRGGSGSLVDAPRCEIFEPAGDRLLQTVRELLHCDGRSTQSERKVPEDAPRITLRSFDGGTAFAVTLRVQKKRIPDAEGFAKALVERLPEVRGVVELTLHPGGRSIVKRRTLAGDATVSQTMAGVSFELPIDAFQQVHVQAAEALMQEAIAEMQVKPGQRWWDLYGGAGVYGMAAVRDGAAEAVVCEIDRGLVEAGRNAASGSGLEGVTFVADDVLRFLHAAQDGATLDGVVVNPPRGGLGREGVAALVARRPRRWIWISCDPVTFARDLKDALAAGYVLRRLVPFDLFPQTAHVETLAVLEASG